MAQAGVLPTVTVGGAQVTVLSDGTIALDGGAMFGVVPRVVWEKRDPPDDRNRVTLGLNVALVESEGRRVLVDTGMGDRWGEKEVRMYRIERPTTLLDGLRAKGLGPEDIDVVVNTHLHFDHSGGNTRREGERVVPTFPRARYVVQRGEWDDARHPHERSRASYRDDDFLPLFEAGQLDLIDGEAEVAPGVRAVRVGGHTTHHQMVVVGEGADTLVVPTDLLPTASHLPLPFVMGYDLFPVATLEAKRALLSAAADGGWRLLFYHDARTPLGRVRREGDGFHVGGHQLSEAKATVGIIGGSGLYEMEGVTGAREIVVDTPFGPPSDRLVLGTLEGRSVAFLPRHGRGHRIMPSEINFQANVYALKSLGVERILSVSAVGSLKEKYAPLHMVVPDQFVDRTFKRPSTFFGRGLVAHVAFARPFCADVSRVLAASARTAGATVHEGGTYICIEGPQFSTRAESELYRAWGMDIIGMTNLQEARLAREAEICYATLAMVTDYDCWHPDHDAVTVEQILQNLFANAAAAKAVLRVAVKGLPEGPRGCECASALSHALITAPELVPPQLKLELAPIIGKYIK